MRWHWTLVAVGLACCGAGHSWARPLPAPAPAPAPLVDLATDCNLEPAVTERPKAKPYFVVRYWGVSQPPAYYPARAPDEVVLTQTRQLNLCERIYLQKNRPETAADSDESVEWVTRKTAADDLDDYC